MTLLHNESTTYLHLPKQPQLPHLGQFRSITLAIIDPTQLALKTDSSRFAAQLRTFAQQNEYVFAFTYAPSTLTSSAISLYYDCDW